MNKLTPQKDSDIGSSNTFLGLEDSNLGSKDSFLGLKDTYIGLMTTFLGFSIQLVFKTVLFRLKASL